MVKECKVTNKSTGPSIYRLSTGFRRELAAGETRMIPVSELAELVQVPGGRVMIENFLQVQDPEVLNYLLNDEVQDEYWLTKEMIPSWMESCSLDEFKDALDFAPIGTLDLIKDFAVKLPLNDYNKRQAVKDQLDFDVDTAVEATKTDVVNNAPKQVRRAANSSIPKPQIKINKPITVAKSEE